MNDEKILTLHPQGKKGTNISLEKYLVLKEFILAELEKESSIAWDELGDRAVECLSPTFDGKVLWYFVTVKLDLEARGIIKRLPKTSPHHLQLID